MDKCEENISSMYEKLSKAPLTQQLKLLKQYYELILDAFDKGLIDKKRFAYLIAGTMCFEATKHGIYNDIVMSAGELELPDAHISGDAVKKLTNLVDLLRTNLL